MPVGWAITVVVLCVAVIALAVIVLGLLRQVTPALERAAEAGPDGFGMGRQGPPVGTELPYFEAIGGDGAVTGEQLRGQPALLLFLSPGCGPCTALAQELSRSDLNGLAGELVVVTSPGGQEELGIPAGLRIWTESGSEVSDRLSVNGTPFAIAVDPDGIVRAAKVPNTMDQLNEIAAVLARHDHEDLSGPGHAQVFASTE